MQVWVETWPLGACGPKLSAVTPNYEGIHCFDSSRPGTNAEEEVADGERGMPSTKGRRGGACQLLPPRLTFPQPRVRARVRDLLGFDVWTQRFMAMLEMGRVKGGDSAGMA